MFPEITLVKRKRLLAELTQKDLAKISGVSQSMIAKIESNNVIPSYSTMKNIFLALEKLGNEKKVCEQIMNKRIFFIQKGKLVRDAINLMHKHSISQLPIKDGKEIIGVIGENILLDKLASGLDEEKLSKLRVEDSMDNPLPTINKDNSVENVIPLVKEAGAILVFDKNEPVGIITKIDLI